MYLAQLKLWNFRKYGTEDKANISNSNPGLIVPFQNGLNVLVGENNSGKTAIVDAIRLVLYTQSYDYYRIDERDFFSYYNDEKKLVRTSELKIECIFKGFNDREAANFLEWLGFERGEHYLKIWLYAYSKDNRVISDIKAGSDDEGTTMEGAAKDLLRVTYLKPLRDADTELSPGNRSRLSQILRNDSVFRKKKDENGKEQKHPLEIYISSANKLIREYFDKEKLDAGEEIPDGTQGGKHIAEKIKSHLESFLDKNSELTSPFFEISGSNLLDILNRLSLNLEENKTGLGVLNQLFIAAELILLQREEHRGLRLCLIEELEAHLHPQAQLRMIDFLSKSENGNTTSASTESPFKGQYILSTHSITLASKIKLNKLILCHSDTIFPFHKESTALENDDYEFLERFLDATKANLFFAKGIMIVEGDAENILIPTIAELLDKNLHEYGVSIVNVGSKALLRYAKILMKSDKSLSPVKVSVVTDLDIAQYRCNDGNIKSKKKKQTNKVPDITDEQTKLTNEFNTNDLNIKVFSSPLWTLEYDLSKSELRKWLNQAIRLAQLSNSRTKNGNYHGLTDAEIIKYCERSDRELEKMISEYSNDPDKIAFSLYQKLDTKKASKAVTAQWFSRILLKNKTAVKPLLESDQQLKYLKDAITHVTSQ